MDKDQMRLNKLGILSEINELKQKSIVGLTGDVATVLTGKIPDSFKKIVGELSRYVPKAMFEIDLNSVDLEQTEQLIESAKTSFSELVEVLNE